MEPAPFNFKRPTPQVIPPAQKSLDPLPAKIKNSRRFVFLFVLIRVFFRKWLLRLVLASSVIVIVILVMVTVTLWQLWQPADAQGEEQSFVIAQGESLASVSERLKAEGLAQSAFAFRLLLVLQGREAHVKAGEFTLSPAMSARRLSEVLTAQAPPERDVTVTIPEGFSVHDIAARLVVLSLIEAEEQFLSAMLSQETCALFEAITPCAKEAPVLFRDLEGYLFPDTYRFRKNATPQEIAVKMLVNFERKFSQELRDEVALKEESVHDIVILASLLEKEVRSLEDRKIVSGILRARLERGMALQVDATVLYALRQAGIEGKKTSLDLTTDDLAFDSPYNTYRSQGLPPGPIANPGLSALTAAVFPEPSPYLFYLSAKDGTTIFSRTFEEHVRAKARYLR